MVWICPNCSTSITADDEACFVGGFKEEQRILSPEKNRPCMRQAGFYIHLNAIMMLLIIYEQQQKINIVLPC